MRLFASVLMIAVALPLAGCLRSDKSESFSATVGGSASGLSGTATLVLNGSETLTLSQNGFFQFTTRLTPGQPYSIGVGTQPPDQTCAVANGSGTLPYASISDVVVTCATNGYAIGGAISGLNGTVELLNGSDLLAISANGRFLFPTRVPAGTGYAVSVRTQPTGMQCEVVAGSGIVGNQDIGNVAINCRAIAHTLGGIVAGLTGSLALSQNGETLTLHSNGPFAFATLVAEGATYAVTVQSQPVSQVCTISNGSGTIGAGDTHDISVNCATSMAIVGGTVSGLVNGYESDVILQLNGSETIAVSSDGAFEFSTPLIVGTGYAVTVATQPSVPARNCLVTNGSGIVSHSGISNVTIACTAPVPRLAFMADAGGNNLSVHSIDEATGVLSLTQATTNGASSYSLALTADKRFVYVANRTPNTITGYAVDAVNGTLSPLPGSPYAVPTSAPRTVSITPDSKFVYTVAQSGNSISTFSIDAATGALTLVGTPVPTGGQPLYSVITPDGKYLYIASFNNRSVYGYAINAATGALTSIGDFAVYDLSTYARALAVDPRGKFLYVPTYSTSVGAFVIDADTGALSPVAGSPFATGGVQASFATVEASGRFLYVTNENTNNISAYSIDGTSGALSPLPGSPFSNGHSPQEIKTDPSGRFLYVSNQSSSEVNVYAINATTGSITLVPGAPFSTSPLSPGGIAILAE